MWEWRKRTKETRFYTNFLISTKVIFCQRQNFWKNFTLKIIDNPDIKKSLDYPFIHLVKFHGGNLWCCGLREWAKENEKFHWINDKTFSLIFNLVNKFVRLWHHRWKFDQKGMLHLSLLISTFNKFRLTHILNVTLPYWKVFNECLKVVFM